MNDWWKARDERERLILIVGGLVALTLGMFQFAWLPSQEYRARAERAHAAALADLAAVQQQARDSVGDTAIATSNQPIQSVITRMADGYGLNLSRLVPAGSEGMNVFIDAGSPLLIYAWLAELERVHGIRVGATSAVRRNSDNQTVNANLYLSRRN